MQKQSKIAQKWVKNTIFLAIIAISSVILINFINDPLWVFNHKNFLNNQQSGFNERQQKTNRLYFSDKKYDSILLGNSKVTYIDQHKFTKGDLFNYSVSAMRPEEYLGYINFSKKVNKSDLKYIIIGLAFQNCYINNNEAKHEKPQFYIDKVNDRYYKFGHLLSYNTFSYALKNFLKYFDDQKAIYDRENVKIKVGFDDLDENFKIDWSKMRKNAQNGFRSIKYNEDLPKIWQKIKESNPKSEILVIFLPDLLPDFLLNKNAKKIFNQCYQDASKILGKTYNYMTFNEITKNPHNYYDGSHFRSYIGDKIMEDLSKK